MVLSTRGRCNDDAMKYLCPANKKKNSCIEVFAAIKIQEVGKLAKYLQLLIEIHLAEVVFENDDVFGDGVNRAKNVYTIFKEN